MKPFPRRGKLAAMLSMSCLVVNGVSSIDIQPRGSQAKLNEEKCPPCEGMSEKLAQHVKV